MKPLNNISTEFIKHYFAAKTKHQIQSPFVYELMSEVLEDDRYFYAFDDMANFYIWLAQFKKEISWEDSPKMVKTAFKNLKVEQLIGQFLFKMANHYQYQNIVEFGSGLNGVWMAQAIPNSKFLLIQKEDDWANVLKNYCDNQSWNFEMQIENQWNPNINISVKIPCIDVLIFDGITINNDIQVTFEQILPYLTDNSLVVINHKNLLNPNIWHQLKGHSRVKRTLDLFQFGLIYFQSEQLKVEHLQMIDQSWKPWARGFFK
jgi:predicted O-methyltransferase YrrM